MLFKKKPKQQKQETPAITLTYTQSEHYRGFKRIKLSSYGYKPALDGIRALTDADLSGADIKINVFAGENPRAVVSIGRHEVGTIWEYSYGDVYKALKNGKVAAVRVEIRDGESYLFYKV